MSDVRLLRVRGNAPYEGVSANPMEATGNKFGEQIVAQGQLGITELSRLGRSYEVSIATANAFTFVAVWPTTRSELVIFNSAGAGGHSLVIDRCWLTNITTQAAAQHFSLLGQITPTSPVIAAPTDAGTTVVQTSLNGKVSALGRLGVAVFALASTAFALANHWFILGNSAASAMTTNLGASLSAECFGRYIIPPGAAFNLAGLAGTAAGTAIIGCEYHEVKLDLG